MTIRSCHMVVVGAWLTAVAVAAFPYLSREGRTPTPSPIAEPLGPNLDVAPRVEAKRRIAQGVLAGRTSLLAAAAALRRLDENPPVWLIRPTCLLEGASEDEDYCRFAISWVRRESTAEQVEQVTKRLQVELAGMIRNGTLRLPDAENAAFAAD